MTRALVGMLLESSVRGLALAILVGGVLVAVRARASDVRHAAWTAVLFAMLAMPVLPLVTPSIPVPIPSTSRAIEPVTDVVAIALGPEVQSVTIGPRGTNAEPITLSGRIVIAGPNVLPRRAVDWPAVVLGVYIAGVLLFLGRLTMGLVGMARLLAHSSTVGPSVPGVAPVLASSALSVPVTTGVWRPRIVLPSNWNVWPPETLAAVVAHEQAHIRRRDPLVLLIAHFNRCVFWFHPFAWWLERALWMTAEQACDDAAVRVIGERARYADILVSLADAVRRRRGRVVWAGVGIDGSGFLGHRIDRILSGETERPISVTQKAMVALGCATAIVIVVACRQQVAAAPLKEDPEVTANLERQKARGAFHQAATSMTKEQVAELEEAVKKNPEDLESRRKLLTFYFWSGQKVLGWHETVAAKRPHVLWMIEHHPEDELSSADNLTPKLDPAGYAQAKRLWVATLDTPGLSDEALSHGVFFLQVSDKPLAEQMLLKIRATDLNGPTPRTRNGMYYPGWTERLGELYALAMLGSDDDTLGHVVKSVNVAEAHNAFAQHARQVLDEARDPTLLYAAGLYLTRNARQAHVDFDHIALGRSYLARAAQLAPSGPASTLILSEQVSDRNQRIHQELRAREVELAGREIARKTAAREPLTSEEEGTLKTFEPDAASKLSELDRLLYLPWLAAVTYMRAESVDFDHHDSPTAKAQWELSKQYARNLLALAPKFTNDPHSGDAIFEGNVVLGMNAYREGDVKTAVRDMQAATDAPTMSRETPFTPSIEYRLVNYLLKAGERDSVATFLEKAAAIDAARRKQFLKDAAAIRAGRMPISYQYMVTPH